MRYQATFMTQEAPLFSIQLKRSWYWVAIIFTLAITVFAIFAVVIPVLSTGSFGAVWPASDQRLGRKTIIFFLCVFWLVSLPAMYRALATGELRFFSDRLEIKTFLFSCLRTFYYKDITVNQHGSYRVTIHARKLPGWSQPLQQLKVLYFYGTSFGLIPHGYKDPDRLPAVLQLLKSSTKFNQKALS